MSSARLIPQHSIVRFGTLIVNNDLHIGTGSHSLAIHFQWGSHSSYYFDSYGLPPFIPPYNPSSDATDPYGTTNRHSCGALLVRSVANIAVSSPCTWIEVIRRNISSDYLLQPPPAIKFPKYSSRNLDRYAGCLEEDSAAKVGKIGSKYFIFPRY